MESRRALLSAGWPVAPEGDEVPRLPFAAPCRGRHRASIRLAAVADLSLHTARSVTITTRRERGLGGWGGAGVGRRRVWTAFVLQISERRGRARAGDRDRAQVRPGSTSGSSPLTSTRTSDSPPPAAARLPHLHSLPYWRSCDRWGTGPCGFTDLLSLDADGDGRGPTLLAAAETGDVGGRRREELGLITTKHPGA